MSYENPVNREKYIISQFDFGAGTNDTFTFKGPKGKAGRLRDYGVEAVTEVFNGSSTTGKIAIGTAANPDAYGEEIDLDGLAADDVKSLRTLYDPIADATSFDALLVDDTLPADTEFVMSLTACVGSPTGIANAFCIVDWDN